MFWFSKCSSIIFLSGLDYTVLCVDNYLCKKDEVGQHLKMISWWQMVVSYVVMRSWHPTCYELQLSEDQIWGEMK